MQLRKYRSHCNSSSYSSSGSSTHRPLRVGTVGGSLRRLHVQRTAVKLSAASGPDQPVGADQPRNSSVDNSSSTPDSAAPAAASTPPAAAAAAAAAAAPATTAPAAASSAPESPADAVSKARQDLTDAWSLLKDAAATAFVPGYEQQQQQQQQQSRPQIVQPLTYSSVLRGVQQQQQQQELLSIPDRLGRLLSGRFIRDVEARRGIRRDGINQQQQQNGDTQFAAMQFEVLQGLQQQQQPSAQADPKRTTAGPAGTVAAVPAVTAAGVIDVPLNAATMLGNTEAAGSEPAAAVREGDAAAAGRSASGFYPASTQVLVVLTWAAFITQWVSAWPDLWEVLSSGRLLDAAAAVLLAVPDTPLLHALCLDLSALQQGRGWWGVTTSGFCHSGLLATWLCCAALQSCGRWLEAASGQLQLLSAFIICSLCAALGHLLAGRCSLGLTGAGTVLGLYTTWCVLATRHMAACVPLRTIYTQGAILLLVLLGLSVLQPAQSLASLLGGVCGGVVAYALAGPLAGVLRWCLALPAMFGLLVFKLAVDLVQVLWYGVVFVAAAAYQVVSDVVVTVKRL